MSDLISRADVIEAVKSLPNTPNGYSDTYDKAVFIEILEELPSAEAVSMEEHIKELNDFAVEWKAKFAKAEKITDEIYDETMAKVAKECEECKERLRNIRPSAEAVQGWIPCSERLPEDSGDYLVCPSDGIIEDYSDFSDVMIMPYDADCEAFGWWTERYDPISLGFVDSDFNEFEVIAWMPLPTPYKGGDSE